MWWLNFVDHPKRKACHTVLEILQWGLSQKTYDTPPTPFPFLAIEKTQSPSDNGGVSDGDQIFSFTISHTHIIKWKLKKIQSPKRAWGNDFFQNWYDMRPPFFGYRKFLVTIRYIPTVKWWPKGWGLSSHNFGGKKFISRFPTWMMEKFRSLFNCVSVLDGNQNVFFRSPSNTPPLSNGDQIFSIAQKGMKWQEEQMEGKRKGTRRVEKRQ